MTIDRTGHPYRLLLVVKDSMLLRMAAVLGADYQSGSFDAAVEQLHDGDEDEMLWRLTGQHGTFAVLIERGEGYLSCSLKADEPHFREGRELMWQDFLQSGGKAAAARDPWDGRQSFNAS